jgi:hypothetical protein
MDTDRHLILFAGGIKLLQQHTICDFLALQTKEEMQTALIKDPVRTAL